MSVELRAGCGHCCSQKGKHKDIDKPLRRGSIDVERYYAVCVSACHCYGNLALGLKEVDICQRSNNVGYSGHGQEEYAPDQYSTIKLPV
ncbi:Uncharacterised protein [uncultured archaeon]|nr:Uncharacterised protein [uncultured archaeon]